MGSVALRGLGRILKGRVKLKGKSSYPAIKPRGKGAYLKTKPKEYPKGVMGPPPIATKKKTLKSEIERVKPAWKGLGLGIAGTLTVQQALKKQKEVKAEGKAKEKKAKKALTRALDRHKKSTKESKEKRGKHHG